MRSTTRSGLGRALVAGLPPALAGSFALAMCAAPAHAAPAHAAPAAMDGARAAAAATGVTARAAAIAKAAAAAPATYTVVAGDTVSGIASRFGLRTDDVLALNGLTRSSVIHPGQVLALTGSSPAPAVPEASGSYTVVAGDTVSGIASRHGTTIAAVFAANGLSWDSIIYPGQTLRLPGGASGAPAAPAAPAAPSMPEASGSYTVVAGDTVSGIASRHGTTIAAVFAANGLSWDSIIYPGQTLRLPGGAPALVTAAAPAPSVAGLDAEQVANARLIIQIGRELGVPDRGIAIALGTAMQESWIRNLTWGDRDSQGLFQQRPSTGWGTIDQVRDPRHAILAFYGGPSDPNGSRTRGLLDIAGWQDMSYADAAQAVQISAYPDRYARWEQPSFAWLAALG